jgi:hypothetical protein
MDEVALEQLILRVPLVFLYYSSFHHCCLLIYHLSLRFAIALNRQHIITYLILSWGGGFRSEPSLGSLGFLLVHFPYFKQK